jgi:hypothetical protein
MAGKEGSGTPFRRVPSQKYPWRYPLDRRLAEPRADLHLVAKRKIPAPPRNSAMAFFFMHEVSIFSLFSFITCKRGAGIWDIIYHLSGHAKRLYEIYGGFVLFISGCYGLK